MACTAAFPAKPYVPQCVYEKMFRLIGACARRNLLGGTMRSLTAYGSTTEPDSEDDSGGKRMPAWLDEDGYFKLKDFPRALQVCCAHTTC